MEEGEDVVTWDGSAVVTLDVAMQDVREGEDRHLRTAQCHLLDIILAVRAHPVVRHHHRGSNKNFSSSSSSVIRASADSRKWVLPFEAHAIASHLLEAGRFRSHPQDTRKSYLTASPHLHLPHHCVPPPLK